MNSKYELKIKIDEIKTLVKQREFEAAADIADTVDWSSVKDINILGMVSDVYKALHEFETSRNILLIAYGKQRSKAIVFSLCELSILMGDLVNAMDYFNEFKQLAPQDSNVYVLQYKLYKAQNISLDEQIEVLENLKEVEKGDGKWLYELALLYHKVGMESKCVQECEDIILWIVDGKYVLKAYELKAQHKPLTEKENFNYEVLRQSGGKLNIQCSLRDDEPKAKEKKEFAVGQDVSPFNTQNLQAVVAEGLQDVLDQKTANLPQVTPSTLEEARALDDANQNSESEFETDHNLMVTQMYVPVVAEASVGQELVEDSEDGNDEISKSDTDILGEATNEKAQSILSGNDNEVVYQLNQNTDEIKPITGEIPAVDKVEAGEVERPTVVQEERPVSVSDYNEEAILKSAGITTKNINAINNTGVIETFHRGSNLDGVLTQGYDGQISMFIPEEQKIEKQITGQMSIDDVMQEWERKKKASEQRLVDDVKSRVKSQASSLLADFDEETKSGLLEQIENAMVSAALSAEHDKKVAATPKPFKVADIDSDTGSIVRKEDEKAALRKAEEERLSKEIAKKEAELKALEEKIKKEEERKAEEEKLKKEEELKAAVEAASKPKEDEEDEGVEEIAEVEEISEGTLDDASEDNSGDISEDIDEGIEDEFEDIDSEEEIAEETEDEEANEEVDDIEPEDDQDTVEDASEEIEERVGTSSGSRDLSDGELQRFSAFVHQRATQRQLANILDNFTLDSYTGNILVSSEEDNEVTTFSKLLIQEIQSIDGNFTGKVAMVSGDSLNKKDIAQVLEKVKNGALIISDPQLLKKKTIEELIEELDKESFGLVIIMQGSSDVLDKIVAQNKGMSDKFNLRIDLKAFDNKTLAEYAKSYAYDNEYCIDELALLALHTRISDLQTADHDVTLSEIEELVDEAIYYADKKTPAHFFDVLFGKRYDKEDMIILRENDFMHY